MASFSILAYTNFAILLLIANIISPIQAKRHYPRRNHKPGYGHKNYGSCRVYKPMNGYNMERNIKMSENDASGGEQQSRENESRGHRVKRIASGTPGQTGAMPWLVFISTTYQFSRDNSTRSQDCTGSLIGPRHVLTNAHCVPIAQMVLSTNLIKVVYGSANKSEGRQILLPKTAAHFHPNYTNFLSQDGTISMSKNNMVLIDLGKELDFDETVSSICLVCLHKNIRPYGDAIIAGWGSQNGACNGLPSIYPDVFRYASVGIHPCKTPDYVATDGVCTFADNNHGIGGGDGGGPVLAAIGKKCHYYQVGVNGRNRCLPSQRENGFEKIDGPWVESVSGIKCMEYAGTDKEICQASLVTKAPIPTTPTNTMETKTPYQCVLPTPTSPSTGEQQCQTEEAAMCQLLKDDESLSADAMEGRRTGTRGNALARQYLIDRLRAMAIQPYPTNLDYTQPFNYTYSNGTATISGIIGMNVISFVPGTRLDQVIVISAHYDHLGIFEGQIYNGADDNASGSSALLYLAQFFACPANKPKNSLMFVHFDGEEGNGGPFDALIIRPVPAFPAGSRYFVQNPPLPLDNIKLNINLDMISRNDLGELFVMRSKITMDKYLNGSMGQHNSTPKLLIKESTFNSDHRNFADANIDYVYFNVGTHVDYHKPSDDYVNIQPQFYMNAVKAIQKIVVQLDEALYEGTF